jgi:hypothetical protein
MYLALDSQEHVPSLSINCVHAAGAQEKCPRRAAAAAGSSMTASTIALVVVVVVLLLLL